mgnify:CR=1 FL=1
MILEISENRELKEFNSLFDKLAYKYEPSTLFDDFLTIYICCFGFGTNEYLYFETIKRYKKDELLILYLFDKYGMISCFINCELFNNMLISLSLVKISVLSNLSKSSIITRSYLVD